MSEDRIKKKRIAHIGNLGSVQGTELQCETGMAQADSNLVYDIMQSMDKAQNVISYQQLQNFQNRENVISRTNNSEQMSSKPIKSAVSKQVKKFIPEKTFPLMAKCQKSMKYLKKNRCIPKPRAHVGSTTKPSLSTVSISRHSVLSNPGIPNISYQSKQNIKKSTFSRETFYNPNKSKISQSTESSGNGNYFRRDSPEKYQSSISITDADSDNEFEKFILKHQPEKSVEKKSSKTRKKRKKQIAFVTKISKISRRTLSESEESAESQVECNEYSRISIGKDDHIVDSSKKKSPSKKFHRIIDYGNSDDCESDAHVMDLATLNNDSSSSSEDENNSFAEPCNEEFRGSKGLGILPFKFVSSASTSTSISSCKDANLYDKLILKCKIPCFVKIERDHLLDKKAASMLIDNSLVTNELPVSSVLDDDDDCIIIEETSSSLICRNSENIQTNESGNSFEESVSSSEILSNSSEIQSKYISNENLIFHSNTIRSQAESISFLSNERSAKTAYEDNGMYLKERHKKCESETSESINASAKSYLGIHSDPVKERDLLPSKTRNPRGNVNSPCEETNAAPEPLIYKSDALLNIVGATSDIEKETFNVQILSVKSLCESDIVDLSDDNEKNDTETHANVKNETPAEDSDIEIICLDESMTNMEKTAKENVRNISCNEIQNEANCDSNKNSDHSSTFPVISNEEDCIILDDDITNENGYRKSKEVQSSSRSNNDVVDNVNNKKMNLYGTEGTSIIDKSSDTNTNSILKILNTIDFDCIKKVLNETTMDSRKEKIPNSPLKTDNLLSGNIRTSNVTVNLSDKLSQSKACSQQNDIVDTTVISFGSDINSEKSNLKISPDDTQGHKVDKFFNELHNVVNRGSESISLPVTLNSEPSNIHGDNNPAFSKSRNLLLPKSEKLFSSSNKTKLNTQLGTRKNQQVLPKHSKMEICESASDELDIIAAKSIKNLDEKTSETILPLLDLYNVEYKKFMEIRCTEENVTAGLKLLEENQAKKLMRISSSIKNLAKNDVCFHKVKNELERNTKNYKRCKSSPVKIDESPNETKQSVEYVTGPPNIKSSNSEKDVTIFHPSIVKRASDILKSHSVGPSSSQEVFDQLVNCVCSECGKHATAACSGCAKVYYCSERCGMSSWDKGHYATCKR